MYKNVVLSYNGIETTPIDYKDEYKSIILRIREYRYKFGKIKGYFQLSDKKLKEQLQLNSHCYCPQYFKDLHDLFNSCDYR